MRRPARRWLEHDFEPFEPHRFEGRECREPIKSSLVAAGLLAQFAAVSVANVIVSSCSDRKKRRATFEQTTLFDVITAQRRAAQGGANAGSSIPFRSRSAGGLDGER
jgi:hypothetical protein